MYTYTYIRIYIYTHTIQYIIQYNTGSHFILSRSEAKYAPSALFVKRIHFAFLQFRQRRRNRREITLRRDISFNGGCSLFFHSLYPTFQGFVVLLSPSFKALVSSTIQILIQLRGRRQRRVSAVSPSTFFFSPCYFFFPDFFRPTPLSLFFFFPTTCPAKSEFNYDPSRNRLALPPLEP